ncbi:MAG: hypothetical protein K0S80_2691 [Neobacillus sp.]|nr:hypothetical protein [Neobacillus sp.]
MIGNTWRRFEGECEGMSKEYQEFKRIHEKAMYLLDNIENRLNKLNGIIATIVSKQTRDAIGGNLKHASKGN